MTHIGMFENGPYAHVNLELRDRYEALVLTTHDGGPMELYRFIATLNPAPGDEHDVVRHIYRSAGAWPDAPIDRAPVSFEPKNHVDKNIVVALWAKAVE